MPESAPYQNQPARPLGERIPPQNIDAEQSVLAALMLSPENVDEILARVSVEDFYRPAHQKIFEAITDLNQKNIPIDQLSLADRLDARGELKEIGGKPYIIELGNDAMSIANWSHHAEIIKRNAMLRELIKASVSITAMGYDAPDDLDSVVEDAERLLFQVTNRRVPSNFRGIDDLLTETFEELEEMSERKEHITGVPTGFADLDKLLAGLRAGDLVILAARPAVGKTAFALNLAVNAAKAGTSVALFSLEMGANQLTQRILCSEARINLQSVRSGSLREDDWYRVHNSMGVLADLDIWVDDTPSISILEVRAKARRQLRNKENGIIIVDYLQLMQPQGRKSESRQVEIAEISRGLKILAKELGMPVIALSQLSRAVEMRSGKRPQLSDLRESGSIEQDADIVMFIDRSTSERESQEDGRPPAGTAEVIVAKHRNGPTGDIQLAFQDHYTKFVSMARQPD